MYLGKRGFLKAKALPMARPAECCPAIAGPPISDGDADVTSALFKSLSDPHRVKIVNLLAASDEPVCVCNITPVLGLSQPTTSFHLKKLVSAGLLDREQRGVWAYYTLNRQALARLSGVFDTKEKVR
jgi:ArsR family transcriptional regulator